MVREQTRLSPKPSVWIAADMEKGPHEATTQAGLASTMTGSARGWLLIPLGGLKGDGVESLTFIWN